MPNTTIENPEEEPDQSGAIIPASDRQLQPNSGNNIRASWNFSTSDVRVNMHHATADRKKVLIDCFLWAIDEKHPSSLNEFAEAVDYDITVVRRLYQGKYTDQKGTRYDIPERLAENAKQWLARQRKKFQGKDEFVLTPTAKRIWTTLELARESKTVAFITGPSHIGKTWALENYSARNNHGASPFIRMKAASGLGGMIRRISETLGNASKGNTADLTDRIKKAVSPDMLLIFDELHLLMYTYRIGSFFACLEVIREIHDETGCGVALCGTQLLLEKMQGGKHTEMEQLLRTHSNDHTHPSAYCCPLVHPRGALRHHHRHLRPGTDPAQPSPPPDHRTEYLHQPDMKSASVIIEHRRDHFGHHTIVSAVYLDAALARKEIGKPHQHRRSIAIVPLNTTLLPKPLLRIK